MKLISSNSSKSNILSDLDSIQRKQKHNKQQHQRKQSAFNLNQSSIQNSSINRKLDIPLITRKMNSIQRYVHSFKRDSNSAFKRPQVYLDEDLKNDISVPYTSNNQNKNNFNDSKFHLQYRSLLRQQSQSRLDNLDRIQQQYVRLKNNIQPQAHGHPSVGPSYVSGPATSPYRSKVSSVEKFELLKNIPKKKIFSRKNIEISDEEMKSQTRVTKIEQQGKKHYADLYLLKKARDKVINSLGNAGKASLQQQPLGKNSSLPEQKQIYQKIFNKRVQKRNKFINARNSHWNVYYDLMALSPKQKKNVKGYEKFMYDYGLSP